MATNRQVFDLHVYLHKTGIFNAATAVCIEQGGQLTRFGFRYTKEYLQHKGAIPLDPIHLPLSNEEYQFNGVHGIPGILDDYLPDSWGRKILTYIAFYKDKQKINQNSCIDLLNRLSSSHIGAVQWTLSDESAKFETGVDFSRVHQAENAAQNIDSQSYSDKTVDDISLLYLANSGSGVGGARPKALITKEGMPYLAKFNRIHSDDYNNARVELAVSTMATLAGINTSSGTVAQGINGREVLLLNRFDIDKTGARKHLISVNSLLKTPDTQADRGGAFRYNDVADLICRYSINVEEDLNQLLKIMLFNRGINNIDDHERNFSFINGGDGYHLSPAYDMVPSLSTGAYHVAGFNYQPSPPRASQAMNMGKIFGLSKTQVRKAAEQVINALEHWEEIANSTGVTESETAQLKTVIHT